jgi:hypothetical protein
VFTEDLDAFFSASEFGLAATYNGATAAVVIFDNEYVEAVTGIAGTNPVALGKSTDFADPVGKTLLISAVTYTIRNKRPIDDGAVVALELEAP